MDSRTGEFYTSLAAAQLAALRPEDAVEIIGTRDAVQRISKAVRAQAKARRKTQKKSRRANRG